MGRATVNKLVKTTFSEYISIHALRGEGDDRKEKEFLNTIISIHALRGEGDSRPVPDDKHKDNFNPRPPWGGRPRNAGQDSGQRYYFNPRPPWGGRPAVVCRRCGLSPFQSTPSVGRATSAHKWKSDRERGFQSTPSVGRATGLDCLKWVNNGISIHALRGEGDIFRITLRRTRANISIHALRGEGDKLLGFCTTLHIAISIHALRGEGDESSPLQLRHSVEFQSTPSVGRATRAEHQTTPTTEYFNPRPPWGGRHLPERCAAV